MFGGVLGALQVPVVAQLAPFEAGLAKAKAEATAGGGGIGRALSGGINPGMIAAAVAIGGLTIAVKSVLEISEKWETSQRGLAQAVDTFHGSTAAAQREVNEFIETNKKFVGSQSEVVDSYAALLRQSGSTAKSQEDLNLALDLSIISGTSLADATTKLQQAEMGRGRALLPLGIQMKEFPILQMSAVTAAKNLEKAQKDVTTAQMAQTAAVKAHGPHSVQAQAAAAKLKVATNELAVAHNYATDRAKASAAVHDLLHQKLDGGRLKTTELKQAQQELGNTWQSFAQHAGPPLLKVFSTVLEFVNRVIGAIGGLIQKFYDLNNAISQSGVAQAIRSTLAAGSGGTPAGARVGRRQLGGNVTAGQDYLVGETGPELFQPNQSGTIIPHGRVLGRGGVTVNINIAQGAFIDGPSVDRLANTIAARLSYATGR